MRVFASFLLAAAIFVTGCSSSASSSSSAASDDPTAVVKKFYDWYLAQPSTTAGAHDWTTHFSDNRKIFNHDLFSMIQRGLKVDIGTDGPIFDFDPFTNSQVGFIGYAIGAPSAKGTDVDVPVATQLCLSCEKSTPWPATFAPSPWPSASGAIVAVVRKDASGNYVIYDVLDAGDSLRGYLQKQLRKPAPAAT